MFCSRWLALRGGNSEVAAEFWPHFGGFLLTRP